MDQAEIKFQIGDHVQTYGLRKGLGLQALAVREKTLPLEFDCRKADCGICLIRVIEGPDSLNSPTPAEADFLKAMGCDQDERLACQCRVLGNIAITVDDCSPDA